MVSQDLARRDDAELTTAGKYTIRSVDRALELLMVFAQGHTGYTLAELARASGIGKPTVHRLVRTLEYRRFIERRSDGKYALGQTLATLGMIAAEERELTQLVAPLLQDVSNRTRETASCTVLDGHEMLTIASVPGRHRLRYNVYPGERVPASLTGDGRIMLAELPRDEMLRRVSAEVKDSGRRISKAWLRRLGNELDDIRARGVAYDTEGDLEPGIACIAVPLRNHRREVVAALLVTVPSVRMQEPHMSDMTAILRGVAWEPVPWSPETP
jgi:DNA-binding IclR family transcriptional regulator